MTKRKLDTVDKIMIGLYVLVGLTVIGSIIGGVNVWMTIPPTDVGTFLTHFFGSLLLVAVNGCLAWWVLALRKGLNE